MTLAKRLKAMGSEKYQADGDPRTSGPGFGVTVHPQALGAPMKWKNPRVVFVNSMSDLFHAEVAARLHPRRVRRLPGHPTAHVSGAHQAQFEVAPRRGQARLAGELVDGCLGREFRRPEPR